MDIIFYFTLLVMSGLTTHYIIKRRVRTHHLLTWKRIAGNITSDEATWLNKNPNAWRSTKQILQNAYYCVRHFLSIIKAKVEKKRKARESRESWEKYNREKTRAMWIDDDTPTKFTNIAHELGDRRSSQYTGISSSLTKDEFVPDPEEKITLDNTPPSKME